MKNTTLQNILSRSSIAADVSLYEYESKAKKYDPRIIQPKYWGINNSGFLTNQRLVLFDATKTELTDIQKVVLDNVSINISLTPTIISHSLKGKDSTVKQYFANNDFDIIVTGMFIGPYDFQQDINGISALKTLLTNGKALKYINAELELNYGIKQLVCTGFSFDQQEVYQMKSFSISFKSDDSIDSYITNTGITVDYTKFPSIKKSL